MRAALIVASILGLAACNVAADAQGGGARGAGEVGQRNFDVAGFDSVSLAGPHDVIVNVGPAHSVRAQGDPEVLERLKIEVDGRRLKIGMEKGNWTFSGKRPKTTIYVTLPAIRGAAIAGSGDMRIDRAEGDSFSGSIAGSGNLDVAALRVAEANFSIAGSGDLRAAGSAGRSKVSIAGSGDVDLSRVETRTSSVSIVGSGGVNARAMETADVSIMGSGDVNISGTAKCSVNKRGSGSVRCGA